MLSKYLETIKITGTRHNFKENFIKVSVCPIQGKFPLFKSKIWYFQIAASLKSGFYALNTKDWFTGWQWWTNYDILHMDAQI